MAVVAEITTMLLPRAARNPRAELSVVEPKVRAASRLSVGCCGIHCRGRVIRSACDEMLEMISQANGARMQMRVTTMAT